MMQVEPPEGFCQREASKNCHAFVREGDEKRLQRLKSRRRHAHVMTAQSAGQCHLLIEIAAPKRSTSTRFHEVQEERFKFAPREIGSSNPNCPPLPYCDRQAVGSREL